MWLWSTLAPLQEESEWQERISDMPGAVISAEFNATKIRIEVYTETVEEALVLQSCYGGTTEQVKDIDWVAATAPENTPPILIRNKIVISASEQPEVISTLQHRYPRRIVLTFPAEMAFGTGNHATTSTCLRMLCDEAKGRKKPWTLTDIGCGTGVLALAGIRLGAESAISFDFDPKAVEVAERNIARNGGADNLHLFQADIFEWVPAPGEAADIVVANLFSTVLQKAFPRILPAMKKDGILIISGILNSQAQETLNAAKAVGLRTLKVVSRGKWTTAKLSLV